MLFPKKRFYTAALFVCLCAILFSQSKKENAAFSETLFSEDEKRLVDTVKRAESQK